MNISCRLDGPAMRALLALEHAGLSRSDAVRKALIECAQARFSDSAMKADAERLARDCDYAAEIEEIAEYWDADSASW